MGDARIADPHDDIITRLVTSEFDDEHGVHRTLTREEALVYLGIISGAGNHTTNRLIG
jgi:cytochrome P450